MAAAASTSMATTAVFLNGRPPAALKPASPAFCPLPPRPSPSSTSFKLLQVSRGCSSKVVVTKATSSDESSVDANELLSDLKEKWDAVENKSTVILYGSGAVVALWFTSVVVGAINSIPLVPKVLELVGLGYAGWFVYRYLLFKSSRKELATDIEELKKKIISGTE